MKYKFCNIYEEWRLHLLERQFHNAYDNQNVIKYLNRQKRILEIVFESIKTVIIPIYIAIYSGAIALMDKVLPEAEISASEHRILIAVSRIVLTLFIIFVSGYWIYKNRTDIHFYEDFIECLKK